MQPSISLNSFDAIIFDLGGVILDLDFERTVDSLSDVLGVDATQFFTRLSQVPLFDQFERGEITSEDFRIGVRKLSDSQQEFTDEQLDQAWNAMLGPIPKAHLEFLRTLGSKKRTFVLSNTNSIHAAQFLADYDAQHSAAEGRFGHFFEALHLSHELGLRKPEARAYQALIDRHGLTPERTIFIDDNQHNVEAATAVGLVGVLHETNTPLPMRFVD